MTLALRLKKYMGNRSAWGPPFVGPPTRYKDLRDCMYHSFGKACNTQEHRSTYQRRANQINYENEKTSTLTNISAGKEPKPQPHMEDEKATMHIF